MKTGTALVPACLLALMISVPTHAEGTGDNKVAGAQENRATVGGGQSDERMNVNVKLHDLELLTQDGEQVKFRSDVIGDKLVAMTFTYTFCTTVCPVYNAIFSQLQDLLGDRLGKDVILVSMSIDPTRDIPRRMKREAQKFKAKAGWYYLTGDKQNVDRVLQGLDAWFPNFENHPPMALVGDGKTGTWRRFSGFPMAEQLLAMLDELKAARK